MVDKAGLCVVTEGSDVNDQPRQAKTQMEGNHSPRWSNGQCVLAVPCCSMLSPRFDLILCRALLEQNGFQIPAQDFEVPLTRALDVPSVRRYMVFNSSLFHFVLAPVLYVVIWCGVFSTLHLYMSFTDYWVLCLCVSLVAIFLTTAIIFVLHLSNKEINMNLDVRLIQVNESMSKHKLLVAVADWVQNCTGTLQLFCVYWDMGRCLKTLTETLEETSWLEEEAQKKIKKRMSHLVLATKITTLEAELGSGDSNSIDEERTQLLANAELVSRSSVTQRECPKVTSNYSLIPDQTLPAQVKAHQLLLTYSAAYVKLLVSERLSDPSHRQPRPRRNHCSTANLCLCQYIKTKILR
ncbi:transmembrane protein 268 [Aplochiton taeniatus]